MTGGGLPHSEIAGSKVVSTYPTLIAGCHVLHRLLVPRHPSCALSNLTKNLIDSGECIRCFNKISQNLITEHWFSGQRQRSCLAGPKPRQRATAVIADRTLPICQRTTGDRPGAITCGAKRDRTANLLVANQALSQLSYSPVAT
jgi:hypothetical protein